MPVARPSSLLPLRRILARLGPTWSAAPARRAIQSLCLAAFLMLLFYVCWPYGATDYAQNMRRKETIPAETFLILDPLLSLSTALAAKAWVPALTWAAALLGLGMVFPRGFCGYLCPLGTLIDWFDGTVGWRFAACQVHGRGWWVHLKYYVLTGTLVAALLGVLFSGFVAAMPVVTRGLQFIVGPLEIGLLKGWYLVPSFNAGHGISIAFFLAVLGLGLLRPRFWCRYVCPTGAVFSIATSLRARDRKTTDACTQCGKCVDEGKAAGYDAIEFRRVGTQVDAAGMPVEGRGFLAPVVLTDKCVGCGLCETRCHRINVRHKRLLAESAIRVLAGPGREDRLSGRSYRELQKSRRSPELIPPEAKTGATNDGYLPDFLK
jgi:polyferredoxin